MASKQYKQHQPLSVEGHKIVSFFQYSSTIVMHLVMVPLDYNILIYVSYPGKLFLTVDMKPVVPIELSKVIVYL